MNENKLIESNIEPKEPVSKYIYDKNMMKKPSLRRLLLSQSSKLEILFLFLGIIGAIMNGAISQLLEYYTGKLITYFSSDNSKESMYENLKDILISYIIVSIFSFFLYHSINFFIFFCFFFNGFLLFIPEKNIK